MCRCRTTDTDDDHILALLSNAVHQGNEVPIAGGQHELLDVGVGVQRAHRIDAQIHVDAVLDRAAGTPQITIVVVGRHIHRFDAIGVECARHAWIAVPVGIGAGDHDAPEIFDTIHDHLEVRIDVKLVANADVDVLEVNEDCDIGAGCVRSHRLSGSFVVGCRFGTHMLRTIAASYRRCHRGTGWWAPRRAYADNPRGEPVVASQACRYGNSGRIVGDDHGAGHITGAARPLRFTCAYNRRAQPEIRCSLTSDDDVGDAASCATPLRLPWCARRIDTHRLIHRLQCP